MADLFYFTYNYGNSDNYSGFGYANTGTYATGQTINAGTNELGLSGNYTIDYLIRGVASSSDVGKIYTYAYYDGDTSKKSYVPYNYSQGLASGTNGLGSEIDYIFGAATGYDVFRSRLLPMRPESLSIASPTTTAMVTITMATSTPQM